MCIRDRIKAKALVDKYKPLFDFTVSKSSEPVSYTHLDVYKRQAYYCSIHHLLGCLRGRMYFFSFGYYFNLK